MTDKPDYRQCVADAPATDHTAFADASVDLYHDGAKAFGEREVATMRAQLDVATALLREIAEDGCTTGRDGDVHCFHCSYSASAGSYEADRHASDCTAIRVRTLLATVAR